MSRSCTDSLHLEFQMKKMQGCVRLQQNFLWDSFSCNHSSRLMHGECNSSILMANIEWSSGGTGEILMQIN